MSSPSRISGDATDGPLAEIISTGPMASHRSHPLGLQWRSSYWFTTFIVGFGIMTDLLVYSIIIPVLPFQLEHLGHRKVAGLVGWLLFAYSGGLVISTIPIALYSEHHSARKTPLIVGLFILVGSQIMLMEAPSYWLMVIARFLQGIGSSMVWIVGLALLCDVTPEKYIGRQLGIAMAGLSLGLLVGPPVGGTLYSRFGWRGPMLFGLIITFFDLVGRLVVIERKEALRYGHDPSFLPEHADLELSKKTSYNEAEEPKTHLLADSSHQVQQPVENMTDVYPDLAHPSNGKLFQGEANEGIRHIPSIETLVQMQDIPIGASENGNTINAIQLVESFDTLVPPGGQPVNAVHTFTPKPAPKSLSFPKVVVALAKTPRALVALFLTFGYGIINTSQEPALPLHLQRVWHLKSSTVGLVYLASVIPTLISSPLTGWLSDRGGSEWIASTCLILALPWYVALIIEKSLLFFIIAFALGIFFISGLVSPVMAELAAVSRGIEGVGYAHVYGAFNLAYGLGNTIGPLLGGQVYDHLHQGWLTLCVIASSLIGMSVFLTFAYTGDETLLVKFRRRTAEKKLRLSLHKGTI